MIWKLKKRHVDAARELELMAKKQRAQQASADASRGHHKRGKNLNSEWLNGYFAGQANAYEHVRADARFRAIRIRSQKKGGR